MWLVIVLIIIAAIIILLKFFNREIITAIPQSTEKYILEFESGKTPLCKLIDTYEYKNKNYYIFIPIESLNFIPLEDIIILKHISKNDNKLVFTFPEAETDKVIVKRFFEEYFDSYNFDLEEFKA